MWLVFGIFFAHGVPMEGFAGLEGVNLILMHALAGYAAPAIGGFVVVGQMLQQYGICIRLD